MDGQYHISRQELLTRVKAAVLAFAPDAEVSLYGSRARGDEHAESDWDFLILLPYTPTESETDAIRHALNRIEWETGEVITTVFYSKHEWERKDRRFIPFRENVRADAKQL